MEGVSLENPCGNYHPIVCNVVEAYSIGKHLHASNNSSSSSTITQCSRNTGRFLEAGFIQQSGDYFLFFDLRMTNFEKFLGHIYDSFA